MSKTVLLPDYLHSKIQESKIMISWVETTISLAKKIELYFEFYMLKVFLQKAPHIEIDLINTEKDEK